MGRSSSGGEKKKTCVALNEHTWYDKAAQMSQLISATSGVGHTFLPESKQRQ